MIFAILTIENNTKNIEIFNSTIDVSCMASNTSSQSYSSRGGDVQVYMLSYKRVIESLLVRILEAWLPTYP